MQRDQQSTVFYELSNMILNLLRCPSMMISLSDRQQVVLASRRQLAKLPPISPARFAFMMLGMSLALMLCGSITFFIGFLMMPWVIGLIMFLYFVGVVSSLSMIGRAIFGQTLASTPSQTKDDVHAWKLM